MSDSESLGSIEIEIRVRYSETDAMGYLHHSNHFNYFEMGRTELFRAGGGDYRAMEERGAFLVVVDLQCKYIQPARYDDLLTLKTTLATVSPAKLVHHYELRRGATVLSQAKSTLACVNRDGQVQRITSEIIPTLDIED